MTKHVKKSMKSRAIFPILFMVLLYLASARNEHEEKVVHETTNTYTRSSLEEDIQIIDAYTRVFIEKLHYVYQSPRIVYPEDGSCTTSQCIKELFAYFQHGPHYESVQKYISLPLPEGYSGWKYVGIRGEDASPVMKFITAHEYGHYLLHLIEGSEYKKSFEHEQFADCYAGAVISFIANQDRDYLLDLELTLKRLFAQSDKNELSGTDDIHGSSSERIKSFKDGYVRGSADICLETYRGRK